MNKEQLLIDSLKKKLLQKEKIIDVLMKRVEREINEKGTAYDSFQAAVVLEGKVAERTKALKTALGEIEKQKMAAEKSWLFMRNVLDNIDDFVGIIGRDRTIRFANKRPLVAAGLVLDDVFGVQFEETQWFDFPGSDKCYIRESIERAFSGEKTSKELQAQLGDSLFWIHYKTSPLFDEKGVVTDVVAEGLL
ncbi:MAG: hypothetical protein DRQ61_10690, partial [Gammaproteobacteria bacterium]